MLIGTHNSASYEINWDIGFWKPTSKWYWLRILAKYVKYVRQIVEKQVHCQSLTISEQLDNGVQVLDLRISYHKGTFYTSHTFCCVSYEQVLRQIRSSKLPKIIVLRPDFENKSTMIGHEQEFIDFTLKWLGSFDSIELYYEPIESNFQLYDIRNFNYIHSYWFNTDSVDTFIKKLDSTIFSGVSYLHGVLTPQKIQNVSILEYANQLNPLLLQTFKQSTRLTLPTICTFDFVDSDLINRFNSI
jgi:hypothetical protein